MRNNEFLDNKIPEDKLIGEIFYKDSKPYRMIDGKKIKQIEEKTQSDKDMNLIINRVRASGMTPSQYLKNMVNKI